MNLRSFSRIEGHVLASNVKYFLMVVASIIAKASCAVIKKKTVNVELSYANLSPLSLSFFFSQKSRCD